MSRPKASTIDVESLMKYFSDEDSENTPVIDFQIALKEAGVETNPGAIAVWKNRSIVPERILIALMLRFEDFDPRDFGWEA